MKCENLELQYDWRKKKMLKNVIIEYKENDLSRVISIPEITYSKLKNEVKNIYDDGGRCISWEYEDRGKKKTGKGTL